MANPYVNRVDLGNETLINLTTDNVVRGDVASGKYFHLPSGERTTGTLTFVTYRTGTTDPASSLGDDGDIYLKVVS